MMKIGKLGIDNWLTQQLILIVDTESIEYNKYSKILTVDSFCVACACACVFSYVSPSLIFICIIHIHKEREREGGGHIKARVHII